VFVKTERVVSNLNISAEVIWKDEHNPLKILIIDASRKTKIAFLGVKFRAMFEVVLQKRSLSFVANHLKSDFCTVNWIAERKGIHWTHSTEIHLILQRSERQTGLKQQASRAMFLKSLAKMTFFLIITWILLQCLTWWRYKTENWSSTWSLQLRRSRKSIVQILHKIIDSWYRWTQLTMVIKSKSST